MASFPRMEEAMITPMPRKTWEWMDSPWIRATMSTARGGVK